jgi:hypothetical protein
MNRKKQLKKGLAILFLVFVGAVVGFLGGSFFKGDHAAQAALAPGVKIALLIVILPAFIFVVAVHEGGHALAGVLSGFDFRLFVAGPFLYEKQNGRWHFKWNRNINVAGGLVVCLPKTDHQLTKKFIVFVAGGPMASLVLAVLFYGLYRLIASHGRGGAGLYANFVYDDGHHVGRHLCTNGDTASFGWVLYRWRPHTAAFTGR